MPIKKKAARASTKASLYGQDQEARRIANKLFSLLDLDCSGYLSQDELTRARDIMLGWSGTPQDANICCMVCDLPTSFDANNDGRVDDAEWHSFNGSLYELLGQEQFVLMARTWANGLSELSVASNDTQVNKPLLGRQVSVKSDLTDAAATKIQKVQRGKMTRTKLAQRPAAAPSPGARAELRPTTLAELWEVLTMVNGHVQTNIEVNDIVSLFADCRDCGLDMDLAKLVPMHFTEVREAEDLSFGEVSHLCMLLTENQDLSEMEARSQLDVVKETCREITDVRDAQVEHDAVMTYRNFKRLIPLLASLMRIDAEYIISTMVWRKTGRFEMTDTLAVSVMERCARKGKRWRQAQLELEGAVTTSADYLWARLEKSEARVVDEDEVERTLLEDPFVMNNLVHMVYNANLQASQDRRGIQTAEIQLLFKRVQTQLLELRKAHARVLNREVPKSVPERVDVGILGRIDFEILMSELYKTEPLPKLFPSPLSMVVRSIIRAGENALIEKRKLRQTVTEHRPQVQSGAWK
mmetsp:Transcript_104537/g.223438  ORF Transcript_104537/g.223438 Transcript_104537/m.223438 type:complete len:525 (+) Transcript_104537:83-1657(+)